MLPLPIMNASNENCINTIVNLVDLLNVRVSKRTINKQLKEHPDYPSLLSITDTLHSWKIDNLSLSVNKKDLRQLPVPFIAQVKENNRLFFRVIKQHSDTDMLVSDTYTTSWKKYSTDKFMETWTGITMLIDPLENAGERQYEKNTQLDALNSLYKTCAIGLVLFLWITVCSTKLYYNGVAALPASLLLTLKLLGVYICCLLLWYEIDRDNSTIKRICKISEKVNCDAILHSEGARVLKFYSWSEIGFTYFAGTSIALILSDLTPEVHSALAWLSLLALPYVFFSVYYQWKVAKQWCIMCLGVQLILLAESASTLIGGAHNILFAATISAHTVIGIIVSTVTPMLAWLLIKPYLQSARSNYSSKRMIARLKYDPATFNWLLKQRFPVKGDSRDLGITLGNPQAKHKVIKVCSPYCGPCSDAHAVIEELLERDYDIQIQIIFAVPDIPDHKKAWPVKHLLAIAEKDNAAQLTSALHDWYSAQKKDYPTFAGKYRIADDLEKQNKKLTAMHEWCAANNITATPTIFLNGYRLPASYNAHDLRFLLPE